MNWNYGLGKIPDEWNEKGKSMNIGDTIKCPGIALERVITYGRIFEVSQGAVGGFYVKRVA